MSELDRARRPFIIFSLPRSRSAWLAWYLSYPPAEVGHDLLVGCRSVSDFETQLAMLRGTVETGAMLGWRLIKHRLPHAKLLIVLRPIAEVHDSFRKLGFEIEPGELEFRAELLTQLSLEPGVDTITFEDLDDPVCCQWLFETLLEEEWDRAWYYKARAVNIQIDFPARLAVLQSRRPALEALKAEVQTETRKIMQ